MLKQKYFLTDFFILSAEKQPIKLSWRNIEWLLMNRYGWESAFGLLWIAPLELSAESLPDIFILRICGFSGLLLHFKGCCRWMSHHRII